MILSRIFIVFLSAAALVGCGQLEKKSDSKTPTQQDASKPASAPTQPASPANPAQPATQTNLAVSDQLPNLQKVNEGLWRSGRPTVAGIAQLKSANIKTIISLETYMFDGDNGNSEETAARQAGIKFLRLPLSGVLEPSVADLNKAYALMNDPANQPVLVHCRYGSDRTGMVIATYRIKHDKWPLAKAKAEMYQFGHSEMLSWWDDELDEL